MEPKSLPMDPPPSYSPKEPSVPCQVPIVANIITLGPDSTRMICPHCHAEIVTAAEAKPGNVAYLSGFLIALLGCWCGCCLIPCMMKDCMDVHHSCPNCKAYLGRYKK